jgi:phosphoglycerate dehydrogenase-like enzyme
MRCAILDDYQNVALKMADWSPISHAVDIKVFDQWLPPADVPGALKGFEIICAMRERTRFPRQVIDALPDLRLLISSGMRNAAIDVKAANERGIVVCGTAGSGNPTAGIAIGLMLELTRHIGYENARLKNSAPWQTTIGIDLEGKTLGIVGLGRLGTKVARIAQAFGMKVIAWSQNLTPETCREAGVTYASKEELFRNADIISIHVLLSDRTRGLIGAKDLALMKPTAYLVNTARAAIVDQSALLAVLTERHIAGAGLDVFESEPLPLDHPLRAQDDVVLTPHLGYVSVQAYEAYFRDMVEDIRAFLDGKPVRVIPPT